MAQQHARHATAGQLTTRYLAKRDALPDTWRTRLHRAISWIDRAEREDDDADARFIFLWIAFNAAYAKEVGDNANERDRLRQFIARLLDADVELQLQQLLLGQFSNAIRVLIENRFVFEPYWRALRDHDGSGRWEEKFVASRRAATKAVLSGDTATVLSIVFDRLYVLRNQLVHGGATWRSRVNREQVNDGAAIMHQLVPAIIGLMIDHPEIDPGEIQYPVAR